MCPVPQTGQLDDLDVCSGAMRLRLSADRIRNVLSLSGRSAIVDDITALDAQPLGVEAEAL